LIHYWLIDRLTAIQAILWKDGPQFHQYQQNEQSHLLNKKKTITYDIGNPGRVLGQVHKCGGLKSDDNRVLQVKPAGNVSGKTKVL